MKDRFDKLVTETLGKSGWFEGRKVEASVSDWKSKIKSLDNLEMFSKAEEILTEFGGLVIIQQDYGKNYHRDTFEINPSLAIDEGGRFRKHSETLNLKLYPLGEVYGGYYFLAVGEDGRVFGLSHHILQIGNDFDEALNNLIVGIMPQTISN